MKILNRCTSVYLALLIAFLVVSPARFARAADQSQAAATADSAPANATFRTKFDRELAQGRPTLICTRVDKGPVIDGEVDKDPVWKQCGRTHGAWTQLATKQISGRQTVVYSCYDADKLYFAFVCEEPNLQNVRMDGSLTQSFQPAGNDDCVEAIIEIGGVQGDGEVYSFRANSRAQYSAWGAANINPLGNANHTPEWAYAGKFGPNRWMLEMAIPFATLKRRPEQKGLLADGAPSRGYVIGLKLLRWGAQQQDPKDRMISTWNTDIAAVTPYIAGANGLLYIEDANSLRDGDFSMPAEKSPWQRKGSIQTANHVMSLDTSASLTQKVSVHPRSFYLLSLAGEGPLDLLLDGKKVPMRDGQAGFWTGEQQHEATVTVQAMGPATISGNKKEFLMQYQPGEKRPGPYCLTNNFREDRNIRTLLPNAPEGRYQYVRLDYKNEIVGDDNPAIKITDQWEWAYDYNLRVEDVGGKKGWIPFSKGSLTGRPEAVFWQTANPFDYAVWGRGKRVVEIDLGQEYFVRDLDVLLPNPNILNLEIWGKLEEEDPWSLLSMDDGKFVEPSKRRLDRRAYESVTGIDSVLRYVMWRITPPVGGHDFPQLDGIQQFWVWGEPRGNHSGIKLFQPWIPVTKAAPKKWTTSAPDPDACFIYPRPRNMTRQDGWFIINPKTRIIAQDEPVARTVAAQVRDEIRQRWQIEIPVQIENPTSANLDDAIYLGQPWRSPLAEQLRKEEGLEIRPKTPQAYALRTSTRRAVVLGADGDGLYWGVQSLMLAMRWHASKDPQQNGLGVRCIKVEDWPATLDRTIFYTEHTPFNAIESEIPRILDNIHLQTRFKWNATYAELSDPLVPWPPGRVAEVCRQASSQYHMEMRPMLMTPPAINLGGWDRIVAAAKDYSVVECSPDEIPEELGPALNLCPLNPRTYTLINARIDELLDTYGHPSKIWLSGIVNHAPLQGSRWGACRKCLKSGKSKDELFAFFAEHIERHLRERHCTGIVEPHDIIFGDSNDPRWRRALVAADFSDLPKGFEYILPAGLSPAKEEALNGRISPSFTADGAVDWPSIERLFRSPMGTDIGTMDKFGETWHLAGGVSTLEEMWYGNDKRPAEPIDLQELFTYGNCWHFHRDLPSWRAGDRPNFFPIDIRPFANHNASPTGKETFEPGRVQEIDLRYVPKGKQLLSGVEFDLIDPAQNNGKNVLMLGRPLPGVTHPKDAANVVENAGPINVGRKLASVAFLTAGWQASTQDLLRQDKWLMPTCRVIYDDDTWLVVDSFRVFSQWDYWNSLENPVVAGSPKLLERLGWLGNSPTGADVRLKVNEWVNPYPEKTIKCLHFVTPAFEEGNGSKRTNPECLGIIALTGVEPIPQDFNYWSKCPDRVPLLPPMKPPTIAAVPLERVGSGEPARRGDGYQVQFKVPQAADSHAPARDDPGINSTLEVTPGASFGTERTARTDCGYLAENKNYEPFAVVQSFSTPVKLCRIEVRGPTYGVDHEYSLGRTHRLDVTAEISEDGQTWRKIGDLKGISGDADFIPLEFDSASVRKIRLTATAARYHAEYNPGMSHPVARWDFPYFVWRLLAAPSSSPIPNPGK